MKHALKILAIILISFQVSLAQDFADSAIAITKSEGASHEIEIEINDEQNMKICIDDESFEMNIRFHKSLDLAIENVLFKHLNHAEDNVASLDGMQFSLISGSLNSSAEFKMMTESGRDRLRNLMKELFVILNWEVELTAL